MSVQLPPPQEPNVTDSSITGTEASNNEPPINLLHQVFWGLGIATILILGMFIAVQVRAVSIPLLVAFCIAYVLNPLVDRFENRGIGRTPAILLLMSSGLILSISVGMLLGPAIWAEVVQIPQKLHQVVAQLRPWVEQIFKVELPTNIDEIIDTLQQELANGQEGSLSALAHSTGSTLQVIFGGTVSVLAALGALLMLPLFVFYFLRDFNKLTHTLRELLPKPVRAAVDSHLREINTTLSGFIRGQLIVGGILAVLYALGFTLVRLPLSLIVGLLTGLGNMIPYVGTGFGLVAATLLSFLSWQGFGHLALIYLVFVVCHLMESLLIAPRVVGHSVGLSPFLVILAVLVFGELFGFLGVLIAVPTTAVIKIIGKAILEHYYRSRFFNGKSAAL